jgi:hypothetical protein
MGSSEQEQLQELMLEPREDRDVRSKEIQFVDSHQSLGLMDEYEWQQSCSHHNRKGRLVHFLCEYGTWWPEHLARSLLEPNVRCSNDKTPLITAASRRATETVERLLRVTGVDVNAVGGIGIKGTALFHAVDAHAYDDCHRQTGIIQLLLGDPRVDINVPCSLFGEERFAVQLAVSKPNRLAIFLAMRGHEIDPLEKKYSAHWNDERLYTLLEYAQRIRGGAISAAMLSNYFSDPAYRFQLKLEKLPSVGYGSDHVQFIGNRCLAVLLAAVLNLIDLGCIKVNLPFASSEYNWQRFMAIMKRVGREFRDKICMATQHRAADKIPARDLDEACAFLRRNDLFNVTNPIHHATSPTE